MREGVNPAMKITKKKSGTNRARNGAPIRRNEANDKKSPVKKEK